MNLKKKYKKPKQPTKGTTNPEAKLSPKPTSLDVILAEVDDGAGSSLLQKDSQWIGSNKTETIESDAVLQLVDCEVGPEVQPLAVLFPGILHKDPETVHKILSRNMSTTDVTKHLVELGQKADLRSIKKTEKLIPTEKTRLNCVPEQEVVMNAIEKDADVSEYEGDSEPTSENTNRNKLSKKKIKSKTKHEFTAGKSSNTTNEVMTSDSTETNSLLSPPNNNTKSDNSDHGYEADAETDNNFSTKDVYKPKHKSPSK